ncbi:TonB-dependent hemoglobin/transferrin/lactoferrin family receptor [Rhizobium sp. SSA_523]|uniref:TonB-dependent hemoglobin/transferrin/lactoferrin family receptor n=1 Tax=Rhizobium sp. SSA_523 TaxID=2952477 RepID=UPI0020900279|nr:TonB-dependent hemoglobin/transferrin/lactoferrin family receptor [Rhizobium sp. SSA_523]MCO5730471.1 TonB-dependent hemoglobin/transferrin/lactoferrin family receptor [Rhizobium sp. SSA_523]WKC25512.1 TonB-dependent hemoglobin/transferrin/lactoferrin family receptor [Rhizobium sp. SSA_523]
MVARYRTLLMACTGLVALSLPSMTGAQDGKGAQDGAGSDATVLERVTIKGQRLAAQKGSATDSPLTSQTTAETLDNRQITEIEDLGRVVEPGVNFNRSTGAVNIRGLEGPRVLTTVDGIPLPFLSDPTRNATGGLDTVNFSSLSAVDVMRGADSSRAGPGALGGVLAYRTLEPEDLIGEGRDWGGIAKTSYDTADRTWRGAVAVAKRIDNTSVLFQGSYGKGHERDSNGDIGGYGTSRTEANPADVKDHNLLFKLRQELAGGHMLGITLEHYRKDRDSDLRTSQALTGNYRPGNYDGKGEVERDRASIDYKFESQEADSLIDSMWASLYIQKSKVMDGYDGFRSTSVIGPIGRENSSDEKDFGLIGAAQKSLEIGGNRHVFTFGFDLARLTSEQYSAGYDNCGPKPVRGTYTGALSACNNLHTNQADTPKVDGNRIGFYIDDEISLGETGFRLTPGLRFDWVRYEPQMTDAFARNASRPALPGTFEDTAVTPKIRLAYDVAPEIELYGQWAMGFRAPTTGELYSRFGAEGTYLRMGNPNLESETSHGFELGANLGDDAFGGRVNLFYNRYKNFIDSRSLTAAEAAAIGYNLADYRQGGISSYTNIARAEIFGVELSAQKVFANGLRLGGGVSALKGNDLENHTFLRSVPPLKAVASIGYDTESWGVGLDLIGVAASRADDGKAGNYFRTPGYGVVDVTAWWEPEQVKGLRINAGVYNVFDRTYYDYSSVRSNAAGQAREFYSEPGRSFKISLTQRF